MEFLDWISTLPTGAAVFIFLLPILIPIAAVLIWARQAGIAKRAQFQILEADLESAIKSGDVSGMIQVGKELIKVAGGAGYSAQNIAQQVYQKSLKLVEIDAKYKRFALEMGRLSYGLPRQDKLPTVYDEQAIKNDIEARLP